MISIAQRWWSHGLDSHDLTVGKFLTRLRRGEVQSAYTVRDIELLLQDHVLELDEVIDLDVLC